MVSLSVIMIVLEESDVDVVSKTTEIDEIVELTGTPADKYEPHERDQHCGGSDTKSNQYIQEFEIPTPCTQPSSITTDSEGKIWFAQSNTGNIAMFDPVTEEFTEYQNENRDTEKTTMMWGIQHTQDDEIWFTDDGSGSLWKFSIPEKTYSEFEFPAKTKKPFPQKIELHNDNFMINDFTGNQVVILNHEKLDENMLSYSSISVPEGLFTSQAVTDDGENIWFVMWKYQKEAVLVKTNYSTQETEQFILPTSINAPNGVSIGPSGNIWIADTAGNSFYKFNPENNRVFEYVTFDAPVWTYGNSTGLIKTPITRPYWTDFDSKGNLWFNEQNANRLSVFDPKTESLIEYDIPSKNPSWADCDGIDNCGLSQSFGFTIQNEKVWFTEWVENNIGVLDTSIPLPLTISIDEKEIEVKQGGQKEILVTINPQANEELEIKISGNTNSESITIKPENIVVSNETITIPMIVTIDEDVHEGLYKILIGTQFDDVAISSFATIRII